MLTSSQKELLLRAQLEINERLEQSKHLREKTWIIERDGWVVVPGSTERTTHIFSTKQDALAYAREVSRDQITELIIQGHGTRIQISHGDEKDSSSIAE